MSQLGSGRKKTYKTIPMRNFGLVEKLDNSLGSHFDIETDGMR